MNKFGRLTGLSKIEETLTTYQATFDKKSSAEIAAHDTLHETIKTANFRPGGMFDDEDFYFDEKNVKLKIKKICKKETVIVTFVKKSYKK